MKLEELIEAFDSKLDLTWYDLRGGGIAADFGVDSTRYTIQLTPIAIGDSDVAEASFIVSDVSGDKAFKTTGKSLSPTAVYGVVANALIDKLPSTKYKAVFFSAERRHSTSDEQHEAKIRIYEFAAKQIGRKLGWERYSNVNQFLLTREYEGPAINGFKHWQTELKEAQGNNPYPTLKRTA